MITRQRTITQQFSQQKSLRSTASKAKAGAIEVTPVSPVIVAETPTAHQAKRLRSSARTVEPALVNESAAIVTKQKTGTTPIEAAFQRATRKSKVVAATEKVETLVIKGADTVTTQVAAEKIVVNETVVSLLPHKLRKAEEIIRRSGLLKDKDNTPTREPEKTPIAQSPSLAHKGDVSYNENLKLPVTYELLLNQFIAADRCVAMMENRGETVTFAKLKTSIETATKRTFLEEHLGQMLSIFPGCFKLNYTQTSYQSANTELTVRADCMAGVDKEDMEPQSQLTVGLMKKRESTFRQGLLKLVVESHANYLKALSPGLNVQLDASKLRRWHPSFPLETATPVITSSKIPARPGCAATPRHWTAKDMLERYAMKTPHLAKLVEKEKPTPAADSTESRVAPMTCPSTPSSFKVIKSGPFAGLREDLVAKVRAREQRDKDLQTVADPAGDLLRIRHSRLPKLIRIVRGLFFRGTKSVSLKDLLATIRYSWSAPISEDEVRVTFDILVNTCPQWIRILNVSISPDPLVQIEADTDINDLIASLPKC